MMKIGEWVKTWAEKSNLHLEYYFETTSTNDKAKSFSYSSEDPVLFVTNHQTQGRGRGDHRWESPASGQALLSSWSFALESSPQPILTPLIGLAVYHTLQSCFKIKDLSLKAPNDLFIGQKKVGGILIESFSEGDSHRVIVGIGLNVLDAPKIPEAVALKGQTEVNIDQTQFCFFLNGLFVELTQALGDGTLTELSPQRREELRVALNKNPLLKKQIQSVEPNGSLIFQGGEVLPWSDL